MRVIVALAILACLVAIASATGFVHQPQAFYPCNLKKVKDCKYFANTGKCLNLRS